MTTETIEKTYTLTIPRAQHNRLSDAVKTFDLDTNFIKLDQQDDTINFSITEDQRVRFSQYATEANRERKKTGHLYWICQMFLAENINTYMKG